MTMELGLPSWNVPNLVFILLIAAIVLALVRLVIGPSSADRVVALDLIAVIAVGMISVVNIVEDRAVYLDAAIALALIGFISTVAIARYLERSARDD